MPLAWAATTARTCSTTKAPASMGSFPWHLDYDEIEYVIEGELHITLGSQRVVGRPGSASARLSSSPLPGWAS